ncbi:MAG TPA: ABC transporter ATP-binding protein, partial [Casimicrobiaceae bacterium]|nr:ABC transporter ATP-binding protein [Casimicrobiaceae bacterium]
EFVTLLGPSGCGKSTLLMLVGGLEDISAGTIELGGRAVTGPRSETGIIFQDPMLLPWKSALDNVLFPIDMMRRPRARYEARALELLATMGLADARSKKPSQLSGGMRQRVAICRALVSDPDVMLMDEPFSALDAITRDELNVLMLDLFERYPKTALFVTHSIREAVLLSDRVLVMGGRPATLMEDLRIPFARPRDFTLTETPEFNAMCGRLREKITAAREFRHGSAIH